MKADKTGEFFETLYAIIADLAKDYDIEAKELSELSDKIACSIADSYAGQMIYVTKHPLVAKRHLEIFNDMKSMPVDQVAKKHKVSTQHVYGIYKKVRAKIAEKNQKTLPHF